MTETDSAPKRSGSRHLPLVLHVSGDFPDPIEPFKTRAICSLIDLTAGHFNHEVVSINRVSPSRTEAAREAAVASALRVETMPFDYGLALTYKAPGKGLRHLTKLSQLGDWLAEHISKMPRKPDLIMGHKLAIEGIAVARAANIHGLPYGLCIQGDSDTKVMEARIDLKGELRAVLNNAAVVFPFAPWAWRKVSSKLGETKGSLVMLPCATELDQPIPPKPNGKAQLLSVFHLKSHKRKNLSNIASAMRLLADDAHKPTLSVIGGGSPQDRAACEAVIKGTPSITLAGTRDRAEVRSAMHNASAFVLPSRRETFGLVFLEALFAGLPIIYPRGTSIDGYFDDAPFALAVDARNPGSIADAMRYAIDNEAELKAELANWQVSQGASRFQRPAIAQDFSDGLMQALGSQFTA